MKKLIFIALMFVCSGLLAQSYQVDYYGAGRGGSNNLLIADADSNTAEYWVMGQIILLQVADDWTASNIGFEIWNPKTSAWEMLYDEEGTLVEYTIVEGTTTTIKPIQMAGVQRVRFKKITSGVTVPQSGAASSVIVHTILY